MKKLHKMQYILRLVSRSRISILAICLFALFSANIFATGQQPLNTISIATPQPETLPYNDSHRRESAKVSGRVDKPASMPSIWPVNGPITSGFGWRTAPLAGGSEAHQGIDIASGLGIPVVATADGTVVQSGWSGGYGKLVQIDHGNGIETLYGHNSQLAVSVGQTVKKGQLISYVGSTGISTGPHVHYEVRENGVAVNPIKYMVLY
ncbi:MAG: M23 family metallopeptidase [Sporomusa sp.]